MEILLKKFKKDCNFKNDKTWFFRTIIKSSLFFILIIALLFVGALLQENSVVDRSDPYFYMSIVVSIVVVFVLMVIYIYQMYKKNTFYMTDSSISQVQGVFSTKKAIINSDKIQDVQVVENFFDKLFHTKTYIIKGEETQRDTQGGVFSYNPEIIIKIVAKN